MDPAADRTIPLSVAMRDGSRRDHEHAEAAGFVAELMAGRVEPERYAAYLRRLRVVYAALEEAVRDLRDAAVVGRVHDESLCRVRALDDDLDHWAPGRPREPRSPAAEDYRARIDRARSRPHLLVAHHYTRYLGDLSGGRMLAQSLRRHVPGLDGAGLAFYEFSEVPKPVAYKRAYRARLDELPVSASERVELVEEVRHAFALNRALLDEVGDLDVTGDAVGCC